MTKGNRIQPAHDLKRRVWEVLDVAGPGDVPSRVCNILLLTLIFLNVVAVVAGTIKPIGERYASYFDWFEIFSVAVFSIEYLARVWSYTSSTEYSSPVAGRLRFMANPMSLIDLLAVLPFYMSFVHADLRFLRALRLFRIFRIAKLGRYSASARLFVRIFENQKEELAIAAMMMAVSIIISSSLMYLVEHEAQPDRFPDILSTMWWSIETLTTVGYGDVYPITPSGKFLASVISILGVGMFAIPTGILTMGFVEETRKQKSTRVVCPHCGKEIG